MSTPQPDNFGTSAVIKKRRQGQRMTAEQRKHAQDTFLRHFAITANLTAAARQAGIDREMVRYWQEHDETFSLRYHQAEAESNDVVRAEIFRRAIQGVDKPLHYQGRIVKDEHGRPATVKDYSDTLLIFLAKSRMPEFRDKQQVDITATVQSDVHHDISNLANDPEAASHANAFFRRLTQLRASESSGSSVSGE